MRTNLLIGVFLCLAGCCTAKKIVCFFDSKGLYRYGASKFTFHDLIMSVAQCTHIVCGYAGIHSESGELVVTERKESSGKKNIRDKKDISAPEKFFKKIIGLKSSFPELKVLLSVGGGADTDRSKYLKILETEAKRTSFVKSAAQYIQKHGFDGLDLAWEFPETKPQGSKSLGAKILKTISFNKSTKDKKPTEHRNQFSILVKQLRIALTKNRLLTLSVMPHVNTSLYYEVKKLTLEVDQVHLMNYDYYTPERNPKEGDYAAPLNQPINRTSDANGVAQVNYWLKHGAPSNKLIYGIPTFARSFKTTKVSNKFGIPPLEVSGPGEAGPYTKEAGLFSFREICLNFNEGYEKSSDRHDGNGAYIFRAANASTPGIWVTFDDLDTVAKKVSFVKEKNLGGVAICDLTLDDFKGDCDGYQYPILTKVRKNL